MPKIPLHWQLAAAMLIGAGLGLTLNILVGDRTTSVDPTHLPAGINEVRIHDTPSRIDIWVTDQDGATNQIVVDGTRKTPGSLATVEHLEDEYPDAYSLFEHHGRSWARWIGDSAQRLGGLFLRMLRMVAVPLIVTSLVTGVMGLGHADRLGKMFGQTLGYYLVTSLLAIVTGLTMVNLIRPGLNTAEVGERGTTISTEQTLGEVLFEQVENLIPANPIGSLANGDFLSIIFFSLAFAVFAILVGGKTAELIRSLANAAFDVMMAMTLAIIKLAPLGVFFLMLFVTATQGFEVFRSLFWYMLTVVCALMMHAFVTLPLIVRFVAGRSPIKYFQAMSPALLTAFSSASSNGTLPLTLACVEERAGVSNRVSSFVLPLGATINMDGTALYEAVAVLYIAQIYHGFNLPLDEQIIVAITALLASIGAAGIPHAGLVMMTIILQAVNLPVEMQGIILAIDRVLDMCRTSVNVWSDSCGCAVISRFQSSGPEPTDLPEPSQEL